MASNSDKPAAYVPPSLRGKAKPQTDEDGWTQVPLTRNHKVPEQKTTGSYVPPSLRKAKPKTFEEEFPTLGGATDQVKTNTGGSVFADKVKALVAAETKEAERKAAIKAAQERSDKLAANEFGLVLPPVGAFLKARRAREAEERRRRSRLFPDEDYSEEEEKEEVPEEEPPSDDDWDEAGEEDENGQAYDAGQFDRHKHDRF